MRRWPEKQYLAWSAKSEAKGVDGRTSNVAFPLERGTLLLYRERERGGGWKIATCQHTPLNILPYFLFS